MLFPARGSADASSGIVGPAWLSVLLAVACIGATVVSMGILNSDSFLFTSDGRLLYLPYLLVVFQSPEPFISVFSM